MKSGYKKKATSSRKKLAKQKRKEGKQPKSLSKASEVLDVAQPAAMGAAYVSSKCMMCNLFLYQSSVCVCWFCNRFPCSSHAVLGHADVDKHVAKPASRREEKKKKEVLGVKTQKLKADLLKKTTCAPVAGLRFEHHSECPCCILGECRVCIASKLVLWCSIKGRKKAARGIHGATNLVLSSVGSQQLQQAQKQLAASLKAVDVDVDMKLA